MVLVVIWYTGGGGGGSGNAPSVMETTQVLVVPVSFSSHTQPDKYLKT